MVKNGSNTTIVSYTGSCFSQLLEVVSVSYWKLFHEFHGSKKHKKTTKVHISRGPHIAPLITGKFAVQALELRFDALKLLAARRRPWPRPAAAEKAPGETGETGEAEKGRNMAEKCRGNMELLGICGNMLK